METEDKDIILEGIASVSIYDQWIAPSVSGQHPKPRYKVFCLSKIYPVIWSLSSHFLQHGAALMLDKLYVFGGNHNGRYLSDLQVCLVDC